MPAHTIHDLMRERCSPRAYLPEPVPRPVIESLLEAARWAPSCFNDQPWRYVVAERGTPAFDAVVDALTGWNPRWAKNAGVLFVTTARDHFSRNGKPNRWAQHDTGAANLSMMLQAEAEGLRAHQMGGFDQDAVRKALGIPDDHTPMSVMAVGKVGPASILDDELAEKEIADRVREPTIAWYGRWGTPADEPEELTELLDFWFGELDEDGMASPEVAQRWWKVDPTFDATLRERFGDLYERALRDELPWASSARGRLGLILLYDQLSRNLFRDEAGMYAQDDRGIALTLDGVAQELDTELPTAHRVFFYMPLMHSEELEHQELCVALFEALHAEAPEGASDTLRNNIDFARKHLAIVERWGRFPHRNERLGRDSTEAELAFLKEPGSSF